MRLVRALTGIFDLYITVGVLAVVTSFCSKQGRRTGDWLAGTVVVRDRAPDVGVSPMGMAALAMPYPLLGWAQQLDLSALPDDVALSARQFLTRMHEMRPDVAARMAHELASEVMRYVVLPAAGTPPWAYLAAITAERRVRQMRTAEAAQRAAWEQAQAQTPAYAGSSGAGGMAGLCGRRAPAGDAAAPVAAAGAGSDSGECGGASGRDRRRWVQAAGLDALDALDSIRCTGCIRCAGHRSAASQEQHLSRMHRTAHALRATAASHCINASHARSIR